MYTHILPVLLTSSVAHAASVLRRDDPGPTVWKSPNGGNTQVRFGDAKVSIGGCEAKTIIDSLNENCYDDGYCNPKPWVIPCPYYGEQHDITVTAPEGQYKPDIKKQFIESIQAAIGTDKLVTSHKVTHMDGGGCTGCAWKPTTVVVYDMPATIGISHQNSGSVPDVITLNIDNGDDKGKGFCEIATGIASGIAGAVNGAAGGLFQLASVACKAI